MAFEALVIIDSRFDGHLTIYEIGITEFYTRQEIIITAT